MTKEIRFTGFGGQGIILAGYITGKAAAIYANLHATLTQNYGPESRGGASSAQLIISDEPIFYPNITHPDILVAMSQEGYSKYKDELSESVNSAETALAKPSTGRSAGKLKTSGIILIDEDLVKPDLRDNVKIARIPATRLAEELGKKMVANIVMLGFMAGQIHPAHKWQGNHRLFTGVSKPFMCRAGILPRKAMEEAIKTSVPPASIELNMQAFDMGFNYKD